MASVYLELSKLQVVQTRIVTVNDLLTTYFARVVPGKAPRTQEDNRKEAVFLRAFFGHMPIELVRPQHIAEYRDLRTGKVRANREIALLSHAFSKAIEWGTKDLTVNPCTLVSRNKEKARERYVEDEEIAAFKAYIPDWMALYVDLKYMTGARKQSLLALTLSDWNPQRGLRVWMEKTQSAVIFDPVGTLPSLVATILALKRPVRATAMFSTRSGEPYTSDGFDSIWKRRMAKFVADGHERFREHDIRGKFATDYEDTGRSAQQALGHKNRKTTDIYVKAKKVVRVAPLK
jgi:integrase